MHAQLDSWTDQGAVCGDTEAATVELGSGPAVAGSPRRRVCSAAGWRGLSLAATVLADSVAVGSALIAAWLIGAARRDAPLDRAALPATPVLVGAIALCLAVMVATGLYAADQAGGRAETVKRVLTASLLAITVLVAVDAVLRAGTLPDPLTPLCALALTVTALLLVRGAGAVTVRTLRGRGRLRPPRVLMVGTGARAAQLRQRLLAAGAEVVAAPLSAVLTGREPEAASIRRRFLGQGRPGPESVDQVILTDPPRHRSELLALMAVAEDAGATFRFVPDTYGLVASGSALAVVDGVPLMHGRLTRLSGRAALGKRLFDLTGAGLGLLLCLPLLLVIALGIKLSDPGPVLYRQLRLGRSGQPVRILKFRTMRRRWSTGSGHRFATAADAFRAMGRPELAERFAVDQKVEDDPRIFGFGRLLRRLSLDELPQLVNVLTGAMSLVGPRPILLEELARYGAHGSSLLSLKPGITGLWQVSGRSDVGYAERVRLDVFYAENWAVALDLAILCRTVVAVASRRGAV